MSNKETKEKVANAFRAMKTIGIAENKVKPVLKNLLKLYDKNWALIEEENYRALADAIFEKEESEAQDQAKKIANSEAQDRPKKIANNEAAEPSKKIINTQTENCLGEDTQAAEEPEERPLKRLRLRHRDSQTSSSRMPDNGTIKTPLVRPKDEPDESVVQLVNGSIGTENSSQPMDVNTTIQPQVVIPPSLSRDKGKKPVSSEPSTVNERCDHSQPSMNRDQQKTQLETEPRSNSHPMRLRDRRPGVASPPVRPKEKRPVPDSSARALCLKEPKIEPDILSSPEKKNTSNHTLITPKDEPITDGMPHMEAPVVTHTDASGRGDSSRGHEMLREHNSPEPSALPSLNEKETTDGTATQNQSANNGEQPVTSAELSSILEIASSHKGEAIIYLNSNLAPSRSNFHKPCLEAVLKCVEDNCFRSAKLADPSISLMNIMKEICQCFVELGTKSKSQSSITVDISPTTDSVGKCSVPEGQGIGGLPMSSLNSVVDSQSGAKLLEPQTPLLPCTDNDGAAHMDAGDKIMANREDRESCPHEMSLEVVCRPPATTCNDIDDGEQKNDINAGGEMVRNGENQENFVQETNDQSSKVVQQSQPTSGISTAVLHAVDIAKGQEKVVITLVNEVNDESPPSFHYIPQNAAFQNAYVNFSLARIGDKNCCANCSKDCLLSSTPCACAHETGGEFAYTSDGLVKEELLKECISMNRDPKKHCQFFCKECPLERSKCADIIEPCKGHLVRKFIKECWWKCGCNMQCGNRVVQRGISHNLQVFMTPGGKGWGLRTLEDLPKGAFVCEYVGEVLTNAELFDRVLKSPEGEKHSYPVLLDADWCAEAMLKDEEALCLDATFYGNVARFINHRCYDSNLVEIPVEVETPDHHYYHLAFFTTRKVKAMEELTWDYGIDFDDHEHPIKAFRCQCGSKFCRNIKRSRSRSSRR